MSLLEELLLFDNQLSGVIPDELGQLTNLRVALVLSSFSSKADIPDALMNVGRNDLDRIGLPTCE